MLQPEVGKTTQPDESLYSARLVGSPSVNDVFCSCQISVKHEISQVCRQPAPPPQTEQEMKTRQHAPPPKKRKRNENSLGITMQVKLSHPASSRYLGLGRLVPFVLQHKAMARGKACLIGQHWSRPSQDASLPLYFTIPADHTIF